MARSFERRCFALKQTYMWVRRVESSEMSVQGWRAFGTELAVEDEDVLWTTFPTHAWNRLLGSITEEVLLQLRRCIDVDRSGDMATVVFIIESAIDNLVRRNLLLESSVQKVIKLQARHRSAPFPFQWEDVSQFCN